MSDRRERAAGLGSVPPGMSGSLEASVTLEEVFAVVVAKRVPLAPELAGYLSLEIAEEAEAASGEIDPRVVFIGDEGTVALVRPKRDPSRFEAGEAEASVRAILARLLDASGSQTPALGAAARRTKGIGMAGLVEELEAALIPVNRAAGRRALARLAREVKRVTLGVGRNASRPSAPSYNSVRDAEPPSRAGSQPENGVVRPLREATPAPPVARETAAQPPSVQRDLEPPPPAAMREPGLAPPQTREPTPAPPSVSAPPSLRESELPTTEITREQLDSAQPPVRDAVDQLLDQFGVSERGEQIAARELKKLVGLEPTPPPPIHEDVVFTP